MDRTNLPRNLLLFLACAAWVFLLFCLGSFHYTDWPSHAVEPHPPTQNLCGAVGASVAYYAYLAIGQGVFPILFFTGAVLVLVLCGVRVADQWMRAVGLLILAIAFAAAVNHFSGPTPEGFPEGRGGVIGIGASKFLQAYFSTAGTRLVLLTTALVGLLLAADDLVLKAPGAVASAVAHVKERAPQFNLAGLPRFGAIPAMVRRDAPSGMTLRIPKRQPLSGAGDDVADGKAGPAAKGKQGKLKPSSSVAASAVVATLNNRDDGEHDVIDLSYPADHDEHLAAAAADAAYVDDADPAPSEPAVIPPPAQQAVVKPAPIINRQPVPVSTGPVAPRPAAPARPAPAPVRNGANDDDDEVDPDTDPDEVIPPPSASIGVGGTGGEFVTVEAGDGDQPGGAMEPAVIRKDIVVKLPNMLKPRQAAPPPPPPKELGEYHLPAWDHLADAEQGYTESQEQFVREQAALLEQSLKEFDIDAHVVEIDTGPVITMYELALAPGIKVSTISGLSNDIQRSLKAETVRIVAPIPGKNTVGIEVPNEQKEKVRFKDLMQLAPPEALAKMDIPLFLGKDASGEPLITDLAKMPHALIAGTTGSGKSVCINTIIMSIMFKQRPDLVKLVLFDPKVVEMAMYKDIPHLMCPVINDASKATSVLEWACEKMDERYEFLAEAGVRNIAGYNKLTQEELFERFNPSSPEEEAKIPKKMPYIVIIIDELADLMMTSGKEVEASIVRIAQKARAVGIHLILATQRPSANVVTGLIKSNMPTRIAFRVQSKMDSRIVLDQNGAECLLGHGDMLFLPPGASKPTRSQGTFIDDKEVRDSVRIVREMAEAQYEPELVQIKGAISTEEMEKDELFEDAVKVVLETKRGSVSLLQRRLTIGYSRASRLIEAMAQSGILGDYKGSQARECNITLDEWEAMKAAASADAETGMSV